MSAPYARVLSRSILSALLPAALFASANLSAQEGRPIEVSASIGLTDVSLSAVDVGQSGAAAVWGAMIVSGSPLEVGVGGQLSVLREAVLLDTGPYTTSGYSVVVPRPAGGIYYVQALVLRADFSISASDPIEVDIDNAGGLDRLQEISFEVVSNDGIPPEYALLAKYEADSNDYALAAAGFTIDGNGQIEARFILKVPGPGEGQLDIAEQLNAGINLGINRGSSIRILAAITDDPLESASNLVFREVSMSEKR